MVFSYYNHLTRRQQGIYRKSDKINFITIPNAPGIQSSVTAVKQELAAGRQNALQARCDSMLNDLCVQFRIPPVTVEVLKCRPADDNYEWHGYYDATADGELPQIKVWMRTAKRQQLVAFKTFLRTLLHEFCHHLDYELIKLEDSFHTEGFYKRENSLFRQLISLALDNP